MQTLDQLIQQLQDIKADAEGVPMTFLVAVELDGKQYEPVIHVQQGHVRPDHKPVIILLPCKRIS